MSASISFQSPQFIHNEIGKKEAEMIIVEAKGDDLKVVDEILKKLGECIGQAGQHQIQTAGMLRHFSDAQLDLLAKKLATLKDIPHTQSMSDVFSTAIYSTTSLEKRTHLIALKNACLGVVTTALVKSPLYPVVTPFKESREIREYIEGVKDLVKKTSVSYPLVSPLQAHHESATALKEIEENIKKLALDGSVELNERIDLDSAVHLLATVLGVDHRKEMAKNVDVQTWVVKNKNVWGERLSALMDVLDGYASLEKRGSCLHGVLQSLSFDLSQVRHTFLNKPAHSKEHVFAFQKMCIILREVGVCLRAQTKKALLQDRKALYLLELRDFQNKFIQFSEEEQKKNGGVQKKLMALLAPEFALVDNSSFSEHFFFAQDLETCTVSDLESILEATYRLAKGSMTDKEWQKNIGQERSRICPFQELFQELTNKLEVLRKEEPPARFEMPPSAPISFI